MEALCARLDELPLALELAAAGIPRFSVEELLERLGATARRVDRPRAPTRAGRRCARPSSGPTSLLDATSGACSRCWRPSAGGCTLDAAEEVCDADPETLVSLADKNLVRRRDDGRFWMLETIRVAGRGTARTTRATQSKRSNRRHARRLHGAGPAARARHRVGRRRKSATAMTLLVPETDNFLRRARLVRDQRSRARVGAGGRVENLGRRGR